jgi:hypothetical protein
MREEENGSREKERDLDITFHSFSKNKCQERF